MAVESRAYEHKLRLYSRCKFFELGGKAIQIRIPRRPKSDQQIARRSETTASSRFIDIAGAWVKWPAMARKKSHTVIRIECVLRAISVVHIPIDNQHAIQFILIPRYAGS